MNPTSKNTGIETKKPASARAIGARDSPVLEIKNAASTCALPVCSRMPPKIAPNPTTVATNPRVDPIPFFTVSITVEGSIPAIRAVAMLDISSAMNAGSFSFKIRKSSSAIPKNTDPNKAISMVFLFVAAASRRGEEDLPDLPTTGIRGPQNSPAEPG